MRPGIIQWLVLGIVVFDTTCKVAALPAARNHTHMPCPSPIHRRPNPLLPPNITTTTITTICSTTSPSSPTTSSPATSSTSSSTTNLGIMEKPAAEVAMYDEHKVVRFSIRTDEQLRILLENEVEWELDYFTHHKQIGGFVDARISPMNYLRLKRTGALLEYEVLIENVQQLLDHESRENEEYQRKWQVSMASAAKSQGLGCGDKDEETNVFVNAGEDWFAGYHLYRDHLEWMKAQIRNHSTIARSFSAGMSFEGRYQAGVKIGSGPSHVVLNGLQHSREWITGSVVEYLIYQLLTGTDGRVAGYLKKYTFHIIPIMNPDGFIITQTTDRLHRKNAQLEGKCLGTDINCNWNFHWNETTDDMSSTDPCAFNYRGPLAFSTPEATNIARYLKSLPNVATYLDIHAYGQLILTPYGFTGDLPPNYNSYLKPLAEGAAKVLAAVHGTQFQAGNIYHTIYPASGSSIDYAMGEVRVPVPIAFELRDTGLSGFMLPADQILPSGQETWAAFAYILDNLKDLR